MNPEILRQDLVFLLSYLLTSAHGLFDEPPRYGPLRLMDAAGRLLSIMETADLSDPSLQELRQALEAQRLSRADDEVTRAFLDQACLQLAARFDATSQ